MPRALRRLVACVALVLVTGAARAESTDTELEAARHTFQRALQLEDGAHYDEALALFRQVATVKASPQVRFHLAFCLHKLGKLVEAAGELDRAREEAMALGPAGEAVVVRATEERNELYASTPRLSVKRVDGTRPPSIVVDGAERTLGDDPIPLDPGRHHVVVPRAGVEAFDSDIVLVERRPAMVAELLVRAPSHGLHVTPLVAVAGGLTVATFAASVATGVFQLVLASKLDGECGPTHDACPVDATGDLDTARSLTTATNVLLVAGSVALVATVVLFFTTGRSRHAPAVALTLTGVGWVF